MPAAKLSKASEIWEARVQAEEVDEALEYARISLPWTFDRMRYGPKSQQKVNERLFHIMVGVLNQTILSRLLKDRGFSCEPDWTGYRESDVFDFFVNGKVYDVKSSMLYAEYDTPRHRPPFRPQLVIDNLGYPGPEWRHFFPVGVPISQVTVERKKDAYIFGIAMAQQDLRKTEPVSGDNGFWCAAPYNSLDGSERAHDFLQSTKVIRARESEETGFFVKVAWKRTVDSLFPGTARPVQITIYGEWNEKPHPETLTIREGQSKRGKQEFSSLSCIRVDHPAGLTEVDRLELTVDNRMDTFVQKPSDPDINLNNPIFVWKLDRGSFVNLRVPDDYRVFWLGWIPFPEFARLFQTYPAYFIPRPPDETANVPARPTDKIRARFAGLDRSRAKALAEGKDVPWPEFETFLTQKKIKAGVLIAAQGAHGVLGAACYYYPPHGFYETELYVLPKDLWPMETLS